MSDLLLIKPRHYKLVTQSEGMTCCYNSSTPLTNKHQQIYVFTYLFLYFLSLQRKVNSTGRCASIVMQLFTVELACLITSGHMQNEKELPYLREPVSAISNTHNKTPTSRVLLSTLLTRFRFLFILLVPYQQSKHF